MGVINENWYTRNEGTSYPVDESASNVDDAGKYLPSDILADLSLRYPRDLGLYPFLAAVSVTKNLVTLVFEVADNPVMPTRFTPLCVVAIPQPVPIHSHIAVQPQIDGVGGWIVFGQGALDQIGYRGRFSSPQQGLLTARSCRGYTKLPVTNVRTFGVDANLTDIVQLSADSPLEIVKEAREIDNVLRDVIVVRLVTADQSASSSTSTTGTLSNTSTFADFAGPCSGRPESATCGDPQPIQFINTVGPDCNGILTLDFRGCAILAQIDSVCGIAIDCNLGLSTACPPKHLPNEDGLLPFEVPPANVPVPPPVPPVVPPLPPPESVVIIGSLPYTECFDDEFVLYFQELSGTWGFSPSDTPDELLYCPSDLDNPYSLTYPHASYQAQNASRENITLWRGFDTTTIGRRVVTTLKMNDGPSGSRSNGGVVVNYRPHPTAAGLFEYFVAYLDFDAQMLKLERFNGSVYLPVASLDLPGLLRDKWYHVDVKVSPGAYAGQASITTQIAEVGGVVAATLGPVSTNSYGTSDGVFGFFSNRSITSFSYFHIEVAP